MGFRFRKSIRLFPGVRLNVSKGGISTSLGGPGATINVGKRGVRGTVGIPGTGLSYSEMLARPGASRSGFQPASPTAPSALRWGTLWAVLTVIVLLVLGVSALLFFGRAEDAKQAAPGSKAETRLPADVDMQRVEGDALTNHRARTSVEQVNCRSNPTQRAKVVATLSSRDRPETISEQAGWTRVTFENNDCWVSSGLLER